MMVVVAAVVVVMMIVIGRSYYQLDDSPSREERCLMELARRVPAAEPPRSAAAAAVVVVVVVGPPASGSTPTPLPTTRMSRWLCWCGRWWRTSYCSWFWAGQRRRVRGRVRRACLKGYLLASVWRKMPRSQSPDAPPATEVTAQKRVRCPCGGDATGDDLARAR
jgi:hypothetical protein